MTRWLVLGAGGMLGREVADALQRVGKNYTALTRVECDITERTQVRDAIHGHDIVINCAAWTDVDGAEKEHDRADRINGYGTAWVAQECELRRARMIHVSTDYVLSGTYETPMDENTPTDPINSYGRSKALGEEWVQDILPETGYIVRTAWLYGEYGPNFVNTMAWLAQDFSYPVRVVDDQWGQPTWARALAYRLVSLGERALDVRDAAPAGIYHATSQGYTTWYGLARMVFEGLGHDPDRVKAISSAEYPREAARPQWSVLSHDRWRAAGLSPYLDHWKTMLGGAMATPWLNARTQ